MEAKERHIPLISLGGLCVYMLKEYFVPFIESLRQRSRRPSTLVDHQRMLDQFIRPPLGDVKIQDLKMTHVYLLLSFVKDRGKSVPNHSIITLRRLLCFIQETGEKLSFDWRDIEIPKYFPKREVEALTKEEVESVHKFLSFRKQSVHKSEYAMREEVFATTRTRALFDLLLYSGMRLSEALSLNRDDVLDPSFEIKIENCKTHKHETVYLAEEAVESIQAYLALRTDDRPDLFVSFNGKKMEANNAKSYLRKVRAKCQLKKNLTHHIFRKTFCTWLLDSGVNIKRVQKLARHKSERTTLKYYVAVEQAECKKDYMRVFARVEKPPIEHFFDSLKTGYYRVIHKVV